MKDLSTDAYAVLIIGIVLVLFAFGIAGQGDYEEAVLQQDIYCEFVELWEKTDGQDGHPDFRGVYDETCVAE
jgi:hypothetical protein